MSKKIFLLDTLEIEDKFEVHTKICNVLYDKIIKINEKQESVNIGLFGEWGSGKSFIIKNLKKKLQSNKICVYEFDAWKFNGKALERSILFELEKQAFTENKPYLYKNQYRLSQKLYSKIKMESQLNVDYQNIKEKFKLLKRSIFLPFLGLLIIKFSSYIPVDFIKSFGLAISNFLNENNLKFINVAGESALYILTILEVSTFIIQLLSKDIKNFLQALVLRKEDVKEEVQQTFSSEEFEDIFKDMIKQIKEKSNNQVLIVFDNIDRCEPKYAYEIITTIKTYMSIKECIYIIPCDDEALKSYLQKNNCTIKNRNYEQEFLDKFFNANIRIPSLSDQNLDYYIKDCLNDIDIDISDEDKSIIMQILYFAYQHQNPRKIKRFINDFSMHYSLALETDKEKQFILDDIEMFTIVAAIKQCWPQLEKKIIANANFRQDFYYNDDFRSDINNEIGKEVVEFLLSVRSLFENDKSIYSYIYYKKSNDEIDIINRIRQGKPVQMNQYNFKIVQQEYNFYKSKNQFIYLTSLAKSVFYSLKYKEGDKFREFETLFNEIILEINKDSSLYSFIQDFKKEDFEYIDNINLRKNSLDKLRSDIYLYIKKNGNNIEELIINLFHSKRLKYHTSINLYLELLGEKSKDIYTYIDYILQDKDEAKNIDKYFSDSSYNMIFAAIVHKEIISINKGHINTKDNTVEFIIRKFEEDNDLIKKYIPRIFTGKELYSFENEITNIKVIYNLGIFMFEKSKKYSIDEHKEFIYMFLNNFVKKTKEYKDKYKDVFYIYYYLTFLFEDKGFESEDYIQHAKDILKINLNEIIEKSITLFGEDYFMEKIYSKINQEILANRSLCILIQNISKECLIKNYNNIILEITQNTIEEKALIEKLLECPELGGILSIKLYEVLCELEETTENNYLLLRIIRKSYRLLKRLQLLDCKKFLDNKVLVNLYKEYPNEIKSIIWNCIDQGMFDEICVNNILEFINKKLEVDESISKYKSICDILNRDERLLTRNNLATIDNILNYILKLGREDSEYDIAYELLKLYEKYESIDKYGKYINDLSESKRNQFDNLINTNLCEDAKYYN